MRISLIAALAANRVIGKNGRLPWHLPSDLKRFRQLTMGHTLLMGRKTYESIGHPLDGRRTIVLSRDPGFVAEGCDVASSIDMVLTMAAGSEELFICGGEEVYRFFLDRAERLYLTELVDTFSGDRFFPEVSRADFSVIQSEDVTDCHNYRFSIFERP